MGRKERETGVIINSKAGDKQERNRVLRVVSETFQETQSFNLVDLENGNIKNIPPTVVIIGGDGTIRTAVSWLATHDEYPQLLIAGGGSTNTFKTALIQEGAKTPVQAVKRDNHVAIDYKPAVIEHEDGEKDFWVISAGLGDFEKDFTRAFEEVRNSRIPHRTRAYAAGLVAFAQNFLSAMSSHEPLLRAYVTSQYLGPFRVFGENELSLSGDKLGLVEVDKKSYYWPFLRGAVASCFWQMKVKAPKQLVKTEVSTSFSGEIESLEETAGINLDGDEKQVKPGKVTIKRRHQPFPVSALIWKKGK
ncbi:MAG: hypothetical protein HYT08_04080 [Candidatus Levybacteria bacterium]|nr:hypothetical protein [Candidatus Levybacteria bacterium]